MSDYCNEDLIVELRTEIDALAARMAEVYKTLAPLVDDDNRPVEALARYAVARLAEAEALLRFTAPYVQDHAIVRDRINAFLAPDQPGEAGK